MISNLKFIDSIQFLNQWLSNLVNNLDKFLITEKYFDDRINLIRRKWVYPSDYMDSFNKFNKASYLLKYVSILKQLMKI